MKISAYRTGWRNQLIGCIELGDGSSNFSGTYEGRVVLQLMNGRQHDHRKSSVELENQKVAARRLLRGEYEICIEV